MANHEQIDAYWGAHESDPAASESPQRLGLGITLLGGFTLAEKAYTRQRL